MTGSSERHSLPIDRYASLRGFPAARKWFLVAFGILLILADLLPNVGIDPGWLSLDVEMAMGVAALAIAFADRLDAQRRTAWRNHAIATGLALIFAGASAEAATRLVFRDVTTSADAGSYFARRWNANNVFLNERGFRERGFSDTKPAGVYRIAVIGDSFTFGNGLEARARYTDRLNEWLPDQFEVLNFGVAGNNTPEHVTTVRASALPAHPDFVLLQWFVNDIEGDDLSGRPRTWPLVGMPFLHRLLNKYSALYDLANMRWNEAQIAFGWHKSYADYMRNRAGDPNSADRQRDAALLRTIIDDTRSSGSAIGIVLFPDAGFDLGEAYPFAFLHDHVLDICREDKVTCLDLRSTFAAVKDRRSLWVSPFDHHPSARANELAALRILEVFKHEWEK